MAADDVAAAVAKVAVGPPLNGTVEIAGPGPFQLDELIRVSLRATNDPREMIADPQARYYGVEVSTRTLVPDDGAQLGKESFGDWLRRSANPA